MFGIGAGELMVLLALALIIVGPQKLPEMARTAGKTVAQFKAYTDEMRSVLSLDAPATPSTSPTSHFSGFGAAQSYNGATEQIAFAPASAVEAAQTEDGTGAAQVEPVTAASDVTTEASAKASL